MQWNWTEDRISKPKMQKKKKKKSILKKDPFFWFKSFYLLNDSESNKWSGIFLRKYYTIFRR